ncbi:MAG: HAD hydrolase family protein [Candidatus Obscuribacterales bacterium]|nr:HAD hydrolase family protein [Steroidobacteraceae bacterium]
MKDLQQRAAAIRLLVLDVDGVLTDGRLYFGAAGEELKCFHVRDGAGLVQLQRAGVQVAVISGRNSPAVDRRMSELGIKLVRQGVDDKLAVLRELLNQLQLQLEVVACIGDDSAEIPLLKNVHLAIAVADAHPSARECAHYVTQACGGRGAVREVCDLIMQAPSALAKKA